MIDNTSQTGRQLCLAPSLTHLQSVSHSPYQSPNDDYCFACSAATFDDQATLSADKCSFLFMEDQPFNGFAEVGRQTLFRAEISAWLPVLAHEHATFGIIAVVHD